MWIIIIIIITIIIIIIIIIIWINIWSGIQARDHVLQRASQFGDWSPTRDVYSVSNHSPP